VYYSALEVIPSANATETDSARLLPASDLEVGHRVLNLAGAAVLIGRFATTR
jgi:hypothetical protein